MSMEISGTSNVGAVEMMSASSVGDIETIMLTLSFERAETMNALVKSKIEAMKLQNEKIQNFQTALNTLRACAPADDEKWANFSGDLGAGTQNGAAYNQIKDACDAAGVDVNDYICFDSNDNADGTGYNLKADGDLQRLTEAIKTAIDSESSNSQLEMIQLQSMVNKSNQAIEMMTNLVQKFSGVQDKIVGNMR